MSHLDMPCAVTADLRRYMDGCEDGERAADETERRRLDRKFEILASADLQLEACTEYADPDKVLLHLLRFRNGLENEASELLNDAAATMAAHEIKDLTAADLRREREEARADDPEWFR